MTRENMCILVEAGASACARVCLAKTLRGFLRLLVALMTLLAMQGCAVFHGDKEAPADNGTGEVEAASASGDTRPSFEVLMESGDEDVTEYLEQFMEITRYGKLPDLQGDEVVRLSENARKDAQGLLGTMGYFSPRIETKVQEAAANAPTRYKVNIHVDPGPQTHVNEVRIDFQGAIATDVQTIRGAQIQQRRVRRSWGLPKGDAFTQSAWASSKSAGLDTIAARRYPTAKVAHSQASINPEDHSAELSVVYDSGPLYKIGEMRVEGSERYDPVFVPRLAILKPGQEYDQEKLLDAQNRLINSGYYDAAFLALDTSGDDPQNAPVIAQVRDAKFQKLVFGLGFSTDTGPGLSVKHTHNKIPVLGWRAISNLSLNRQDKYLGTDWIAPPEESGWRWIAGGNVRREETGDYTVNSARAMYGRSKTDGHIDRSHYLQYDYAKSSGTDAPPSAAAIMVNTTWLGRYFNSNTNPTRGMGLAGELGVGMTQMGGNDPFVRLYGRWLQIFPIGLRSRLPSNIEEAESMHLTARRSRIALRLEGGAVIAASEASIPSTIMFLTGGDTTVRGYGYRKIGARVQGDRTFAGRYMAVASVEWQRPIIRDNRLSDWEHVVFVDTGAVTDDANYVHFKTGVGTGVRWRSPVGPMQADLAYGLQDSRLRLHLRMGFSF